MIIKEYDLEPGKQGFGCDRKSELWGQESPPEPLIDNKPTEELDIFIEVEFLKKPISPRLFHN